MKGWFLVQDDGRKSGPYHSKSEATRRQKHVGGHTAELDYDPPASGPLRSRLPIWTPEELTLP